MTLGRSHGMEGPGRSRGLSRRYEEVGEEWDEGTWELDTPRYMEGKPSPNWRELDELLKQTDPVTWRALHSMKYQDRETTPAHLQNPWLLYGDPFAEGAAPVVQSPESVSLGVSLGVTQKVAQPVSQTVSLAGPETPATHRGDPERIPASQKARVEGQIRADLGGVPTPKAVRGTGGESKGMPKWLGGVYRPRNLTDLGREVVRYLAPDGAGMAPWIGAEWQKDLDQHLRYLAQRYTALDLIAKGVALERDGMYFHRETYSRKHRDAWHERLGSLREGGLDEGDVLKRIGVLRVASSEQLFILDPKGAGRTHESLEALFDEGLIQHEEAWLWEGRLGVWTLTDAGQQEALRIKGDLVDMGAGARMKLFQNREFHEQAVGDAILYFEREAEVKEEAILRLFQDRAIRARDMGKDAYVDLRFVVRDFQGPDRSVDVEVVGAGWRYGSAAHHAKVNGGARRSFNPRARVTSGGRHVGIGR